MKKRLLFLWSFSLLILWNLSASAQTKTITGTVADTAGVGVSGASVKIKGTTFGTITNSQGNFSLKVSAGNTLVVSSVNYETQEVAVGEGDVYNITLKSSETSLNDIVVTALGIKRQSKELGYSTASISSAKLNQAGVINPATGMAAKVAGVDIRLTDNGVNPQVKVTFRGSRSIEGNNEALIVVDGIPVDESYLANMNPSDFESTTILKGSNAAALYGMAASNGVMNITTKKGNNTHFSLNYQNIASFESISYFPKLQGQYGLYGGEYNDPFSGQPAIIPYENESYGPPFNSLDPELGANANFGHGDSIPIGINGNQQLVYGPYKYYPNGRKDFFQTGFGDQNKLSGSIGGKKGGVYFSGEHTSKQGVVPKDTYDRSSFRINGNVNLGRLTVSGGFGYSSVKTDIAGNSYNQYRPVYWNVINSAPNIDLKNFKDLSEFQNNEGYIGAFYPNPWWSIYNSRSKSTTNQLLANLQLNYKFTDWLSVTARGGYSRTSENAPSFINSMSFPQWLVDYANDNPLYFYTAAQSAYYPYQKELIKDHYGDFSGDLFLTLNKKVNKFNFNFIVGGNYRARNSYGYWFSNDSTSASTIGANIVPSLYTKVSTPDGSYATYNFKRFDQSLYGDLTIGYDDWLFLHGSFRNDWTSILAPGLRSFNYPSVDLSAVLSDKIEALRNSSTISFLKLRVGYAETGNVSLDGYTPLGVMGNIGSNGNVNGFTAEIPNFGAYAIYPTANLGSGFPFASGGNSFSQNYEIVQGGVNPTLKPERTHSVETGFQLGLFKNRVNLEASYYNQISENQTVPVQTSYASGVSQYLTNAGKIRNNGLELDLNLTPLIQIGDFRFDLDANFAYQNTKVVQIEGNSVELSPISYGTTSLGGIFATAGKSYPEIMTTDFNRDVNGHIIVNPTTGLPSLNPNLIDAGSANYKYFVGVSPTLSYKGFSLTAVFDYRGGAKILNEEGAALDFAGISTNTTGNRQAFIIPNSVIGGSATAAGTPNVNVPISAPGTGVSAAMYYYTNVAGQIGMPYVISANFLKLRELNLSYQFPQKMFENGKVLKGLTLSAIGRNLFMWRPKTNIWTDPEFSTNANGNAVGYTTEFQTPPTRVISVALSADLF